MNTLNAAVSLRAREGRVPSPRAPHGRPPAVVLAVVTLTAFVVGTGALVVVGARALVVATVLPPLPVDGGEMPVPG